MIDYLGDTRVALNRAGPAELRELYRSLRLEVVHHPEELRRRDHSDPVGVVNVSEGR
jgi:hypothetical protein